MKNSKSKGNRFERSVAKFFQEWTGYEFNRTPMSGGLRWKNAENITSDIVCSDPKHSRKFKLSIECKSYQDINFEHLLLQKKSCKIASFWNQAKSDAKRAGKIPVLIMKYNGMARGEAFFVVDDQVAEFFYKQNLKKPYMNICNMSIGSIHIFMLSDIKKTDYKAFHKYIETIK